MFMPFNFENKFIQATPRRQFVSEKQADNSQVTMTRPL